MGTKQVKMEFQVAADDGVSAQVTITAGGTQVFSGAVGQTANPLPDQIFVDSTPFSLVEFDLDVADMPTPWGDPGQYGQWTTPVDITISVSGGSVCLQETAANYSTYLTEITPPTAPPTYHTVPGNATIFSTLRYATQPVWTPTCTDRLNIADNVDTGPGSLLLLDSESVAYQVSMTLYSA
jgi:hypothetical protein